MFLSKLVPIVFQHHWTGKGGTGEDKQNMDLSSGRSLCMEEAGGGVVQKYLLQDISPVEAEEMLTRSF